MSIIPEFIFRATIARGFRAIRQDTRLLDQLFRNLDQQSATEMRDFILSHQIYLDINYPREDLKLPAIIILLRGESEAQAFLGDSMGVDCVPNALTYDDLSGEGFEVLGGAASVSTLSGEGPLVFGPFAAASGTLNTLKIATKEWDISKFQVGTHTVHIVGGTGVGQQREIASNSNDTIMTDSNWGVIPDSTSVFVVRKPAEEVVGEPRSLYTRQQGAMVERLGSLYNLNYQIQVISPNPELTVYLHAIVKSIFTLSRTFMEKQGIINMQLGATDFVPRAEYQPDFAYMRALNVDFQYPFDIFSELGDLAEGFRIALEVCPEDPADDKVIASDTTC